MPDKKPLKLILQHIVPQHPYSRLMGWLTHCEWPWLKNYLIGLFIRRYQVDMRDALINDPYQFKHFNDFFTRALKQGTRPLPIDPSTVVSPVDGAVIECRIVQNTALMQVKGQAFDTHALLGGDSERSAAFIGGDLISLYLAPRDYHRVHMPVTGKLREMVYIPGKLFSVNPLTTEHIPNVLARNERVVSIFDTEIGPVALILVGAMIVASIETVWAGIVAPTKIPGIQTWRYDQAPATQPVLQRGEEMGRFQFGSTVVVLFPPNTLSFAENMRANAPVQLGQPLGILIKN
jgi:phosphatidylserine decarboxylase